MRRLLPITMVLFLLASLSRGEEPKPRLALCPSGDEKADGIVALMEVTLSKDGGVVLLDRAKTRQVLVEHKLALEGLLSTDDALKAGQLLQCDIFAELHGEALTNADTKVTSLVVFDALTGVRFCDETLPQKASVDQMAQAATTALIAAVSKYQGQGKESRYKTISLLSVRNVDLPPDRSGIVSCIGPILERQLLQSPNVAVLERKRLDHVNRETDLGSDRRDRLLISAVLLEMDISRQDDGVCVRVSLSDIGGKEIAHVTENGSLADIGALSELLADGITGKLKLAPAPKDAYSKALESDRFAAEYQRVKIRGGSEDGLAIAQSAMALAPDECSKQQLFCDAVEASAGSLIEKQRLADLITLLERDFDFREGWNRRGYMPTLWGGGLEGALKGLVASRNALDASLGERLTSLRHRYKALWEIYSKDEVWSIGPLSPSHIKLWATNADEWIEAMLVTTTNTQPPFVLEMAGQPFYSFADLSPAAITNLIQHYEKMAEAGDLEARLTVCQLLSRFRDIFPDSETRFKRSFTEAMNLAVKQGSDGVDLLANMLTVLTPPQSPPFTQIPKESRWRSDQLFAFMGTELLRLADLVEERNVFGCSLWTALDQWNKGDLDHPGSYLVRGYAQVTNPQCILGEPKQISVCHYQSFPRYRSKKEYAQALNTQYRKRFNRDIPDYGESSKGGAPLPAPSRSTAPGKLFVTPEGSFLQGAELDGESWYLACAFPASSRCELHRVNADTGEHEMIGAAPVDFDKRRSGFRKYTIFLSGDETTASKSWQELSTPLIVGKRQAYLPMSGNLILFPFSKKPASILNSSHLFPNVRVISVAEVEDHLYLGCVRRKTGAVEGSSSCISDEGLLVRCDLDGQHPQILSSSARREVRSGLDNCNPYVISGFYSDIPRRRLVLAVTSWFPRNTQAIFMTDVFNGSGLWSLDLATDDISWTLPMMTAFQDPPRALASDTVLLSAGNGMRVQYCWHPDNDGVTYLQDYLTSAFHAAPFLRVASGSANAFAVLHGEFYDRWQRIRAYESPIETPAPLGGSGRLDPFVLRTFKGRLQACTTNALWQVESEPLTNPTPVLMELEIARPRAFFGQDLVVKLTPPRCDSLEWEFVSPWRRPTGPAQMPVQTSGETTVRIPTPANYVVVPGMIDAPYLNLRAKRNGEVVGYGYAKLLLSPQVPFSALMSALNLQYLGFAESRKDAGPVRLHGKAGVPFSMEGLRTTLGSFTLGVVVTKKDTKLADLIAAAGFPVRRTDSVAQLSSNDTCIALVSASWLDDGGAEAYSALLNYLDRERHDAIVIGPLKTNPFLPAWLCGGTNSQSPSYVGTMDPQNALTCVAHNTASFNEGYWDPGRGIDIDRWDGEDNPAPVCIGKEIVNVVPMFEEKTSGTPFICEVVPARAKGRLFIIPLDLVKSINNEPYAGPLLTGAIFYAAGTRNQWRTAYALARSATERALRTLNVANVLSPDMQRLPSAAESIIFAEAAEVTPVLREWVSQGGRLVVFVNACGDALLSSMLVDQELRNGLSDLRVERYRRTLNSDAATWRGICQAMGNRHAVIPGLLDSLNIGNGWVLIVAVPETINDEARAYLSILLTTLQVRLGPSPQAGGK